MAGKYFELAFELSGKTNSSLKSAFKGFKVDVDSLNKKISELEKTRGNVKRFEGLRKDILKTNREYKEAQKNVNKLAKEVSNATNPTKKLQNEFQKAQKEASNLKHKFEKQKDELRQLKSSMDEAGVSTKNFAKDQAKLEKTLNNTIKAQAAYNKSKSNLDAAKQQTAEARGRLVDAVAVGATLAVPVKLAIDAENTMADIKKVVDFADEAELKGMEKTIMDISKEIPMTFNEIGQIIAAGGQSGIDKIDLPQFAVDSAKMGIAFDIEAGEAGQTMAEWRAAFGMNQKEVVVLADKINYLGNTTAASAPKISEVVSRIGPLGDVGGVASGEIAALGATLVGMGVGEEVAATGIKNLILTMNSGSSATKKQKAAFKSLGLNAEEMAKKMQTDSKGAILELLQALQKVPEHARAASLKELVGKESIGAIAPLLTNLQELEKNFNAVDEAQKQFSGSMEGEFQARAATTENSIILLKNQVHNMGITLGQILLPPIVELVSKFAQVAEKIQAFADKHPELTSRIVKTIAAIMAFSVAMIGIRYAGSLVKQSFMTVAHGFNILKLFFVEGKLQAIAYTIATKAMSAAQLTHAGIVKVAAAGQAVLNTVMAAFPGILIVTAIVAIIAAIVAMIKHWDKVKETIGNLWGIFAEKFPGMAAFAEKAGSVIKNTFGKAIEWVSGKTEWLGNAWDKTVGKLFKGKKSGKGKNTNNIPAYATGGIVTTPQLAWIAEGGVSEAIIPLEKTANSMSLWERAGRALGINMSPKGIDIASGSIGNKTSTVNNNTNSGDKYELNFNIDAKGAAPGVEEAIKNKLLQEVIPIIMRTLEEKRRDKLRVNIN